MSVSKEDHPIEYSMDIDLSPFCSTETIQPSIIEPTDDRIHLKDLLSQRQTTPIEENKRARIPSINLKKRRANNKVYRLFAVINHHGGSSDVGEFPRENRFSFSSNQRNS